MYIYRERERAIDMYTRACDRARLEVAETSTARRLSSVRRTSGPARIHSGHPASYIMLCYAM